MGTTGSPKIRPLTSPDVSGVAAVRGALRDKWQVAMVPMGYSCSGPRNHRNMDVGQNGRPRGPQMLV